VKSGSEVRGLRSEVRFSMLLYYITDRSAFPGDESARRSRLLGKIGEAAGAGVDYIQLREKDLTASELESLAKEAIEVIAKAKNLVTTTLLINSRTDIALAVGAAGVHLRSSDVSPAEVKAMWQRDAGALFGRLGADSARELPSQPQIVSISCHTPEDVTQAAANGADLAILAPVFEKKDAPGTRSTGLSQLREACRNKIPVLALGGITLENGRSCLDSGAAGIAAIRLFQENDIAAIVRELRR
jgi:thiamine-phosphate pyrophosphorylase